MNKQQLQQKVANMEAELAEMKLLLSKPDPTINYWQPKSGDSYFYIDQHNDVKNTFCTPSYTETRYRVFKTETEAQKYADYIKAEETLRKAIAEANEGWLPDWNTSENKFHIYISIDQLCVDHNYKIKRLPNFMYIKSRELAQNLIRDYEQEFITYLSY